MRIWRSSNLIIHRASTGLVTSLLIVGLGSPTVIAGPPVAAEAEALVRPGDSGSVCVQVPNGTVGDVAVINITNTHAQGTGYGAIRRADDTPIPDRAVGDRFSSVNFAADAPPNPNLALATIGTSGRICYDGAVAPHHVILDHVGTLFNASIDASDPSRVLDTRGGAQVQPGTSVCVAAPTGDPGDTAVVNITNTAATGTGFGAIRASDSDPVFGRSATRQFSSVNFAANTPANPNLAIATIGSDGRICYDGSGSTHHVILDFIGAIYGDQLTLTEPTRVLDSRSSDLVEASSSVCVSIPGGASGDVAIVNVTNTQAAGNGYGALRSSDATPIYDRPIAERYSSVNFAAGTPPNPNLTLVTIGQDGEVCYDGLVSSHHVILDYFATVRRGSIEPVEPARILDTRTEITDDDIANMALPIGTCFGDSTQRRLVEGRTLPEAINVPSIYLRDAPVRTDFDNDGYQDVAQLVNCNAGGTAVWQDLIVWFATTNPRIVDPSIGQPSSSPQPASISSIRLSNAGRLAVNWEGTEANEGTCCSAFLVTAQLSFANRTPALADATQESPSLLSKRIEAALAQRDRSPVADRISLSIWDRVTRLAGNDEIEFSGCTKDVGDAWSCYYFIDGFLILFEVERSGRTWFVSGYETLGGGA